MCSKIVYNLQGYSPIARTFKTFLTFLHKGGWVQCRGVLLLWHMVGQGPAVLATGAGLVGCFLFFHLFYDGLDGGGGGWGGAGVWNSLISKNLAHYSLSLKFLLIL